MLPLLIQAPNLLHIHRGKTTSSQIDVTVGRGLHVQANPASKKSLIPTELWIEPPQGVSVVRVNYPSGTPFRELSVYQGNFGIHFDLKTASNATTGKQLVHGKIHYQACDEKACFRPGVIPFDFWVEIQ